MPDNRYIARNKAMHRPFPLRVHNTKKEVKEVKSLIFV